MTGTEDYVVFNSSIILTGVFVWSTIVHHRLMDPTHLTYTEAQTLLQSDVYDPTSIRMFLSWSILYWGLP